MPLFPLIKLAKKLKDKTRSALGLPVSDGSISLMQWVLMLIDVNN